MKPTATKQCGIRYLQSPLFSFFLWQREAEPAPPPDFSCWENTNSCQCIIISVDTAAAISVLPWWRVRRWGMLSFLPREKKKNMGFRGCPSDCTAPWLCFAAVVFIVSACKNGHTTWWNGLTETCCSFLGQKEGAWLGKIQTLRCEYLPKPNNYENALIKWQKWNRLKY